MTPINKQSKKARRAFYALQRGRWYGICPATRVVPSKRLYSRREFNRVI